MASTAKVIWQCHVESKGEGDQWKDFNEDESRKLEEKHEEQKNEPNTVKVHDYKFPPQAKRASEDDVLSYKVYIISGDMRAQQNTFMQDLIGQYDHVQVRQHPSSKTMRRVRRILQMP